MHIRSSSLPFAPQIEARSRGLCLEQSRTIAELKAVSQNLMHADLKITDKVYGVLTGNDVQGLIAGLADVGSDDQQSVVEMLELLLEKAKRDERA